MTLSLNKIDDTYGIYEDDTYQKLGTDTVLLSEFAAKKPHSLVCDIGSGQGGLSLLMLISSPTLKIHGVEIDKNAAQIAQLNMDNCGFSQNYIQHIGDIRSVDVPDTGRFDEVVSNPPYFPHNSGSKRRSCERQTARADDSCTAADLCAAASRLLRFGGTFSAVYRCERLAELLYCMKQNKIEPKVLQLVQYDITSAPKIFLVSGKKGAAESLRINPPIILKERYKT